MAALTDEQITKMAKARVSFKVHAFTYVIVNLFLMAVWMMTSDGAPMHPGDGDWGWGDYWPMWTHLGWGIGLAFHGFAAYGPGPGMVEQEEQRIRDSLGKR